VRAPESTRSSDADVVVSGVDLDVSERLAWALAETLSPDERARSRGFRLERDARRFVVARACLRATVAHRLDVPSSLLRFGCGPAGKPYLRGPQSHRQLQFNVAHADGVAVYATAFNRAVGIDIERIRPLPDLDLVAERFFSPFEREVLASLPSHRRSAAFYRCWTRKEAYLKCLGTGLDRPLDSFDVAFAEGEPAALLRVAGHVHEPARWSMASLELWPGHAAAVVAEGNDWSAVQWGGTDGA
jgi:4'-phosphopantetheinyl transferase